MSAEFTQENVMLTALLFVLGLAMLVVGAELLVRGASRLASSFGIPSLIIGLTVVAFGTSAPEFAVSLKSALANQGSIAVGNVVGSNIFNVLFVLGISALICPLVVSKQLIRVDVPLMIAASVLALLLSLDHQLGRMDGILLVAILLIYTGFLVYEGRKSPDVHPSEAVADVPIDRFEFRNVFLIVVGLVLLVFGSRWLVNGAVAAASYLGVSELIIGLTIVALGTSLPEVVTSIVASLRGERDIAVGNVIGSNLFNLLGVLGGAALVSPAALDVPPSVISLDLPFMIAVAFACLPVFFTGGIISRWEGGVFFAYYFAYTTYLILMATSHDLFPAYRAAMLYFVIPLTVVTIAVVVVQSWRRRTHPQRNDSGVT